MEFKDFCLAVYYIAKLLLELIDEHKKNRPQRPNSRR